jgi:ion channel-forming bestrophin family protein
MGGEDGGGGGGGAGEAAAPPSAAAAGAGAVASAQQGPQAGDGAKPRPVETNGVPLDHVTSPMSPRGNTPNPFSRKNTSLDLDDYFVRLMRFHLLVATLGTNKT